MRRRVFLTTFLALLPTATIAAEKPRSGAVIGAIEEVESGSTGVGTIWLRHDGIRVAFSLKHARIVNGQKSQLSAGVRVKVRYKGLELSEMDLYYTAEAIVVDILNSNRE
jgi:hypothetical protein